MVWQFVKTITPVDLLGRVFWGEGLGFVFGFVFY